jgi:hypothetical protein
MAHKTFDQGSIKQRSRELAFRGVVNLFFGTIDAIHFIREMKLRLQARRKR